MVAPPRCVAMSRRWAKAAVAASRAVLALVRARLSQPLRFDPKGEIQPAIASVSGDALGSPAMRSRRPGARGAPILGAAERAEDARREDALVRGRVPSSSPASSEVRTTVTPWGGTIATAVGSAASASSAVSLPLGAWRAWRRRPCPARAPWRRPWRRRRRSRRSWAAAAARLLRLDRLRGPSRRRAGIRGWFEHQRSRLLGLGHHGRGLATPGRGGVIVSRRGSEEVARASGARCSSVKRTRTRPSSLTGPEQTLTATR